MRYNQGRPWLIRFTVFFFLLTIFVTGYLFADTLSSESLLRLSQAVWLEEREYFDIPEEQLLETVLQDRKFDEWVAQKARQAGLTLTSDEKKTISSHGNSLKISLTAEYLTGKIEMSSEELQVFAEKKGWLKDRPERFEVFYLFIDGTDASGEEEEDYYAQKAREIREKITKDNFRDMARLWSDVPSAERGGSLGLICLEGRGPTFSQHVRQTEPGTISPPLPTPSGWNIIYVRNHIPEEKREFTDDELLTMVRSFHAASIREKLRKEPDLLSETWKEVESDLKKYYREELSWYEDFLLAKHYFRSRMRQKEPCEEGLREIYQDNKDSFQSLPSFKARDMLLSSEKWSREKTPSAWLDRRRVRNRARELRKRVLEEEKSFAELARRYSVSNSAAKGGDIGWITPPSSALYDRTLADLKPGKVSVPLSTDNGYLLLYLEDIKPPKPFSFEEVKDRVKNSWYGRTREQLRRKLREEWKNHKK